MAWKRLRNGRRNPYKWRIRLMNDNTFRGIPSHYRNSRTRTVQHLLMILYCSIKFTWYALICGFNCGLCYSWLAVCTTQLTLGVDLNFMPQKSQNAQKYPDLAKYVNYEFIRFLNTVWVEYEQTVTSIIYYSKFAKDHCLGWHYISRQGYHAKTKHGMYSRTCLFPEFHCFIPNLNNM